MRKFTFKLMIIATALTATLSSNAQTPVAYYPFSGNADDAIGTLHGTVNGATLTTDHFGNPNSAYQFDGNDHINLTNSSIIRPTSAMTVSAWFTLDDVASSISGMSIFSCTENGGYGLCYIKATNILEFAVRRNGSYARIQVTATPYTSGAWHHFAGTYDGQWTRLYMDGALVGSNDAGGVYPITYNNTVNTLLGAEPATPYTIDPNYYLNGAIDEVKIYNTALTALQVQDEYEAGPLPLNLISFTATEKNCTIELQWQTVDEINVSHFEVETSTDGMRFLPAVEMTARNTAGENKYSVAVSPSAEGQVFYRLKMVDVDGQYTYSKVLQLATHCSQTISIQPNPVINELHIKGVERGTFISLTNLAGQTLYNSSSPSADFIFDMSRFPAGVYILRAGNEVFKVIKH